MSLSSILLPPSDKGKGKAIDKGLDDLFRTTAPAPATTQPHLSAPAVSQATSSEKKRKAAEETSKPKAKRSKSDAASASASSKSLKRAAEPDDEESDSNDEDKSSDDEGDPSKLVHESLLKGGAAKGKSRSGHAKHAPSEETPAQRDARTVFVGNVAVDVAKSRPKQKQLKRHLLSFVPSAKIESVRFRSVAFKKPTAELPDDDKKPKPKTREHVRERTAAWRADDKDEAEAAPPKRFLDTKEKKRIAFIKHEIHDQVDSVNAYVVFAHPLSAEALASRPANLPPPAPIMDPYEAARHCAEKGDGSTFLDRTLRIDVVKKGGAPGDNGDEMTGEHAMAGDPKATVFVGNLDFASKEEDLRAFFESVVTEERGKPGEKEGSDDEDEDEDDRSDEEAAEARANGGSKPRTWVKRVRIIRDRDTQLGKGFAYVQFIDRECVDEILALDQSKLKFAKRKLRVQRCKTLPGGPKLRAAKPPVRPPASSATTQGHPNYSRTVSGSSRPAPAPRLVPATRHMPKGNPELGVKLAHLPKDERKKVKSTDPDRVARRLAKKRAKALADKGVKMKVDRERVRKRPGEKKAGAAKDSSSKPKKRVRSGKALMKMNTKK